MNTPKKILLAILPATVFLLPLLFIPLFINFYNTPKVIALTISVCILIASATALALKTHKLALPSSPLNLPLLLIMATTIINLILTTEARPESFLGKGILLLILPLLSFFILSTDTPRKLSNFVTIAFGLSSTILAVISTLQLLVLYRLTALPSFMQVKSFTLTGSPFVTASLLLIGLAITLSFALKNNKWRIPATIAASLNLVGLAAYAALMFPGQELAPTILPHSASWSILLDSAKSIRAILFGVGFANFPVLFSATKPLYLNGTPFWNIIPETSSSEAFNLITTGGLLLFASFVVYTLTVIKNLNKINESMTPLKYGFLITLAILLLTPGTIITYTLFFIFGALLLSEQSSSHTIELKTPPLRYLVAAISAVLSLTGIYVVGKAALADYYLREAQIALNKGDGKNVYDNTLRGVRLEPSLNSYRVSYSQVNLTLAGTLSSQKQNPSEEDRKQIAQLVSQAVREAKAATSLRPNLSSNWGNLANIYRNLIGVADGSSEFAVTYMKQAVALDAGNPLLRVEYGGLLYQLAGISKDETTKNNFLTLAAQEFQTAIKLKANYANAYYNLGKTFEAAGNKEGAQKALESAISYLSQDSTDYQTAKTELETLKSQVPTPTPSPTPSATPSTPTPSPELTNPSPLPSPMVDGPIILPEESPTP